MGRDRKKKKEVVDTVDFMKGQEKEIGTKRSWGEKLFWGKRRKKKTVYG